MVEKKVIEYAKEWWDGQGLKHQEYKGEHLIQCPSCGVLIRIERYPKPHDQECEGAEGKAKWERASRGATDVFNKIMSGRPRSEK